MTWEIFQLTSLLISAVFLAASIRLLLKTNFFSATRDYGWHAVRPDAIARTRLEKTWKTVLKKITTPDVSAWKEAIALADGEFDELLRSSGYRGTTPEERLVIVDPAVLPNISRIRVLRNELVPALKDEDASVDYEKAKELLREYRAAFRQLGMMK